VPEINAEGVFVYEASWLNGWGWSAGGPKGLAMGHTDTEEEAWKQARAALRTLGVVPMGQG
jgi:hypothetical protein